MAIDRFVLDELQRRAGLAVAQHEMIAQAAGGVERGKLWAVGVQHRDAARHHHIGEQAQLGGDIGRHGAVIIQMVARERGETADGQAHAVDAELMQAVAGGFHGEMGDAVAGHIGHDFVQAHRIGRGQAAVDRRPGAKAPSVPT